MASIVTPSGRISYPVLFEPKAQQQGQAPKYSCILLIPKDGLETKAFLERASREIQACIEAKWPDPSKRPAEFKKPIKDGDKAKIESGENTGKLRKDLNPEVAGHWILSASSSEKFKPTVANKSRQIITDPTVIKAGYWCRLAINFYAYSNVNVGVSAGLQHVLFEKSDTIFGSDAPPADVAFDKYFDADSTPSSTGVTVLGAPVPDVAMMFS